MAFGSRSFFFFSALWFRSKELYISLERVSSDSLLKSLSRSLIQEPQL